MIILTELMNRVFSDPSGELANKLSEKVEEAKEKGTAELKDSENNLELSKQGDKVIVKDNENGEHTQVSENEKGESELKAVTKTQSATLDDVEVKKAKDGIDPELDTDTIPNVEVTTTQGVTDKNKSGTDKAFSVTFNNLTEDQANEYIKSFSNMHNYEDLMDYTSYYSDQEAMELVETANELFSHIEELDENSLYSDFEEAYGVLDALYSEVEAAQEAGAKVSELARELGKAEAKLEEKVEEAAEAQESEEESADQAEELAMYSNQLFSAVDYFTEDPSYELAQAIYSDSNLLIENLGLFSEVDSSELYEHLVAYSELAEDYIISQEIFSDQDAEDLNHNMEELDKAAEHMKETQDPELAKKVKVLADTIEDEAEVAKEAGVEGADEVKAACRQYSEEADKVIEAAGEDPKKVDEKIDEAKSAESEEEAEKKFSALFGENRTFSATTSNSCLTSTFN